MNIWRRKKTCFETPPGCARRKTSPVSKIVRILGSGHSGDFFLGKKKVNRTSCGSSKIARLMVSNIPKNGEKIWNWQGELAKTLNKAFLHLGRFLKLPMFSFLALYFP